VQSAAACGLRVHRRRRDSAGAAADQPLGRSICRVPNSTPGSPLLSLPRYFATVPAATPYLGIDPLRTAALRRRYEAAGRAGLRKIGVVFQANPESGSATDRSLPIGDLAPLLRTPGVDFVNLQGGAAGRRPAAEHAGIIDAIAEEVPLDEFAAAVAATDLLVTVDTMAAHCAGALGHPVWLIIRFSPHWCWGIGRDHTPWCPTARLFRQAVRRDWSAPSRSSRTSSTDLSIKY